jgi:hypothetical protein
MERGMKEFDFLRGLEWYKTSYTNQFRNTKWLYIFRRRGLAYWSRNLLDNIIRPVYRRLKLFFHRSSEKHNQAAEPQSSEEANS